MGNNRTIGVAGIILGLLFGLILSLMVLVTTVLDERGDPCGPLGRGQGPLGGGSVVPGAKVTPTAPGTTRLTSGFGPRWGTFHYGTDFAGPLGTPIYAAYDGQVVAAADSGIGGFGGWIILSHVINGQPVETTYGHMDPGGVYVKVGDQVRAGQHIAAIGNSGGSTGPHLHFEVRPGIGRAEGAGSEGSIDPVPWLEDAVPPNTDGAQQPPPEPGQRPAPSAPPVADDPTVLAGQSQPLPATVDGAEVAVYGDSLAVGATDELNRVMPGTRVIAEVGRDFAGGAQAVRADLDSLPKHVVLELGTNNGVEHGEYQALVDEIKRAKPDAAVVVVTPAGDRPWIPAANEAIGRLQGVQIADWHGAVQADPSLLGADAVHPSPAGTTKLVELIAAAIGGAPAPQIANTAIDGCNTVGAAGTLADVDLSKIPEEYHEPLRRAAQVCPEFDMIAFVGKIDLESGFQASATSPDNGGGQGAAMGPGQFLKSTWDAYGKDWNGDGKTDIYDPADAIPSSMAYNCENLKLIQKAQAEGKVNTTDDLTDMTLAAYQGGPGAVLAAGGMPHVCDINICSDEYSRRARAAGEKYRASGASRNSDGQVVSRFAGVGRPAGQNVVKAAQQYLGRPYMWGGNGPTADNPNAGLDCSGLTSRAMREGTGGAVELPRTAREQWTVGEEIPIDQAQPGDLVFGNWTSTGPGHVAVAMGNGRMVEAPQSGMDVMEADVRSDMRARRIL